MQAPIQSDRLPLTPECEAGVAVLSQPKAPGIAASDPIPDLIYDLRLKQPGSGGFYADVSEFSDKLLAEIDLRAEAAIVGYSRYVQTALRELPRSPGEYSIELLTLGLMLTRYARAAEKTSRWVVTLAQELFWLRRKSPQTKPFVDLVRAAITRRFLMGNTATAHPPVPGPTARELAQSGPRLLDGLPRLIEWLHATGEFEQETARLNNWRSYLHTLPRADAVHWIETSMNLFDWFQREADAALGVYTRGVSRFLAEEYRERGCREDQIFCGKELPEYHLSMVAAEIMNRGLRPEFERKTQKVVLVPACMRGSHAMSCQADVSGTDIQCAACSSGCAVNRLTSRMRSMGAKVFLVPHSTGFSQWLERWQREPDTAVVAAACLLNILPGGYEMRARGIASQCVPLDYPGCGKHWHRDEIATSLNEDRLVQLVQSGAAGKS